MSSLKKILLKHRTINQQIAEGKNKLLPEESPLVPAIIYLNINIQVEGRINTTLITEYLSLITLSLFHDLLYNKGDLKTIITPLWVSVSNILRENAIIHQLSSDITEMMYTSSQFSAFTETSSIPSTTTPFTTRGIRSWEFQGSENSFLITTLKYQLSIKAGSHHLRDHLRSTGHIMLPYPPSNYRKIVKELHKWLTDKNKNQSQVIEYLLLKLMDQRVETLTTVIHNHQENNSEPSNSQNTPTAPPLDYI